MSACDSEHCCPKFDPEPWEEKMLTWEGKRFVRDRVRSFFHIPRSLPREANTRSVKSSNV